MARPTAKEKNSPKGIYFPVILKKCPNEMLPSWNHENCCKHLVYAALSFVAEKQLHLVLKWTTMEFNGKKSLLKSNNSGKKSMIMKLEVTHFRMKVQQTFTQWKFVNWDSGLQMTSLIKFSRLEFKRTFFFVVQGFQVHKHMEYHLQPCMLQGSWRKVRRDWRDEDNFFKNEEEIRH